jgi:hypothetical protein
MTSLALVRVIFGQPQKLLIRKLLAFASSSKQASTPIPQFIWYCTACGTEFRQEIIIYGQ